MYNSEKTKEAISLFSTLGKTFKLVTKKKLDNKRKIKRKIGYNLYQKKLLNAIGLANMNILAEYLPFIVK